MTPCTTPSTATASGTETNLEGLFARIAATNPFTDNRSGGSSASEIDVPNIHGTQFERLIGLAREAHAERRGLGVVLWGEAGIGKSHLLARFARWADEEKRACFVYLHNLQARPENLPRSLLKAALSILTRGQSDHFTSTVLFRLANAFMREALQYDPDQAYTWQDLESGFAALVDGLSAKEPVAPVDRALYDVVLYFFRSAYLAREGADDGSAARFAVRWLAGDALDPPEARRLGLPPGRSLEEPAALADDQQIKQVLAVLCRLALSRGQPCVLCFDQVDNLDTAQAAALARFLAALLDSSANLLVVISGIQATLLQWRNNKVIQDSAWDRLAQFEIALLRTSVAEGREIVAARLQRFFEPVAQWDTMQPRLQEEPLFPLGNAWADTFLKDKVEVRPRDMLTWAREGWQREQAVLRELGGAAWLARSGLDRPAEPAGFPWSSAQIEEAIDAKVAQKVAEQKVQREVEPHTLPPNAGNLAGLVGALLESCLSVDLAGRRLRVEQLPASASGKPPRYDLIVQEWHPASAAERRIGMSFLCTGSAYSATAALRRLVQDPDPPQRVYLITDERTGLPLGPVGAEHYKELHQRGHQRFRHLQLTFAQYAELDSLQGTVGLARARDLEIELPGGQTRPVSREEVVASLLRQRCHESAPILNDLLADISGEAPEPRPNRTSEALLRAR
jgi:hypothetical protein